MSDTYYDWLAGRGSFAPKFISPQTQILASGKERTLKKVEASEGDLRFLLLEITSSTSSDNIRLIIETDSFYFNNTMAEMANYNFTNMVRDYPSLIVSDPNTNRYVVLFKPIPPLHFNKFMRIKVINEESDSVLIKYALAYTEVD